MIRVGPIDIDPVEPELVQEVHDGVGKLFPADFVGSDLRERPDVSGNGNQDLEMPILCPEFCDL